jgi:CRP/FNR family transcriptional regulator, cyclic AMP receptor protein
MLDPVELVGYAGTTLTITAYAMRDSVRLRLAGIGSSVAFLAYGVLSGSWPVVATELILLPLNSYRLFELLRPQTTTPPVSRPPATVQA